MITGASRNPLDTVAFSRSVPLKEKVAPGAISVSSIKMRDELHVVDPVLHPAELVV